MFRKKILVGVLAAFLMLGVTGCGSSRDDNDIVILRGNFSEINILVEMAAILIEENTDLNVVWHDEMITINALNAVQREEVDLWVSYDGTLLVTILNSDPEEVPEGAYLFDFVNEKADEEVDLMLLGKFGFENTFAFSVQEEFAAEHDLYTMSDVIPFAPDLIFGAKTEFFDLEGTVRFNPMNEFYGFEWAEGRPLNIAFVHTALDAGEIEAAVVYSTDGLNVITDLRLLEDDLGYFPEYYASFVMRTDFFDKFAEQAPNLREVLDQLTGLIDTETMTELNYLADTPDDDMRMTPREIAYDFLRENGLID
jgi:glycine betaine/choline ABC-type transport system substrate-binding protein